MDENSVAKSTEPATNDSDGKDIIREHQVIEFYVPATFADAIPAIW